MKRVVAFRAGRVPAARPSNHAAVIKTTDCRGRWSSDRRCPNRGARRRMDPNKPSAPETVIRRSSCKSGNCRRSRTPGNNSTMDCPRCWSGIPSNCKGTTHRCWAVHNNCSTGHGRPPPFLRAIRARQPLLLLSLKRYTNSSLRKRARLTGIPTCLWTQY